MNSLEFRPQWFESISKSDEILKRVQDKGRKSLLDIGYPNQSDEEWRMFNLKNLKKFINLPIQLNKETNYKGKYPIFGNLTPNIFQLIIDPFTNPLNSISLPDGIQKLTSKELNCYLGQTIEKCQDKGKWPILINESSAKEVIGLKINGKMLPNLEIILTTHPDSFVSSRIILIVEDNTNLNLMQVIVGSRNSAQSNLIEINIGKQSEVQHSLLALGEGDSNLLSDLSIEQDISSNYSLTTLQLGWHFSRLKNNILQTYGQAKTSLRGLQVSNQNQQVATHSWVKFNGPDGNLSQLNKAAASGHSHSIFNGEIEVPQIAQKTEASQLSRNLLLSNRAKVDTKPELKIIADDVRCTHGATVSQLQEEELFYLKSRGINSKQANALLLEGYYQDILNTIPFYSQRWSFLKDLLSKSQE